MSNDHERVQSLFLKLVELAPGERAAALGRECGADWELRARVEELLKAAGEADSFLDGNTAAEAHATANPTAEHVSAVQRPGEMMGGRYKLLEQIGVGGMGAVWMAEQKAPVKRKVAIKLVKAGMDSQQVLARFEAERQALALMDHPNIAKVFDGGVTEQGRPFFVMELVKGVPLTEYCNEARLSLKERLNLFIPVCQAVQHAHQKGIIHRDLKPSNILICLYDGKPVPKVIDFGLAKAMHQSLTDQSLHTGFGMMVGTPLYMSPEQAEHNNLDVDTRTDIYSLGVILYELLTGTTPLEQKQLKQAAYNEILRLIKEVEPPKPSTRLSGSASLPSIAAQRSIDPRQLSKSLTGDLDWIVMKSLDKERSRRYETASGLARDIERFLNDDAVEACPPTKRYRLKKLLRRNKGPVIAAGLVFLALVIGVMGTTLGLLEARRQAEIARKQEAVAKKQEGLAREEAAAKDQARAKEAAQRKIAEANEKKAIQAATEALAANERESMQRVRAEKSLEKMAEVLDAMVSGVTRDSLVTQIAITDEQKKFLTGVLTYYRDLMAEKGSDDKNRARIASAAFRIGLIEDRLGRTEESVRAFQEARDLYASLAADSPGVAHFRQQLALCHNNLGNAASDMGKTQEAEAHYREAVKVQELLASGFFVNGDHRSDLALSYNNLGALMKKIGKLGDAEKEYAKALAVREKLAASFPKNSQYQSELAKTHNHLGILLRGQGKREAAEKHHRQALLIREKLATEFPAIHAYRFELAATHMNLGNLLSDIGRRPEAEAQFSEAVPALEKLAAQYPSIPDYQRNLADCYTAFGGLLRRLGKLDEAEVVLRKSVVIQENLAAAFADVPEHRYGLAASRVFRANLLEALGKPEEAEDQFLQAVAIQEQLTSQFPTVLKYKTSLGASYGALGALTSKAGKQAESLEWLGEAIQTCTPLSEDIESRNALLRMFHGMRAQTAVKLEQFSAALDDWDKVIALTPHEEQAMARASRAIARLHLGQIAEALAEVEELAKSSFSNVRLSYSCACFYAIASGKVPDRKQEFLNRAMELLQQAVKAGFKNAAHMKQDTDLDPLREREDFKQLMTDLEKQSATP